MPPSKPPEVNKFLRVAIQRFSDAQTLFRGGRNTAAIYLAGYAVECGLKALLLSTVTTRKGVPAILESFRGSGGHNLGTLKARYLKRSRTDFSKSVAGQLVYVNSWTTSLRYEPSNASLREARRFLDSTQEIITWIQGRI